MTKWRGSEPRSDRTSVTISKRVHRLLRMASASTGITQKVIVESAIEEYMKRRAGLDKILKEEED